MQHTASAAVPSPPFAWGVTAPEWAERYRCDELADPSTTRMMRATGCAAGPERLWPWLCQLRVAPYSYDLLDNWGRRSPRRLTPSLTDLRVGQRFMTIFDLVDVTAGEQLTLRMRPGRPTTVFGDLHLTYQVVRTATGSRLVAAMRVAPRGGPLTRPRTTLLGWGDLVMMRQQLLTLTALAAGSGR